MVAAGQTTVNSWLPCVALLLRALFLVRVRNVDLKNSSQLFLPAKIGLFRHSRELQLGKHVVAKTIGKFSKQRRGLLPEKKGVGKGALNESPWRRVRVQRSSGFLLAEWHRVPWLGALLGKKNTLLLLGK